MASDLRKIYRRGDIWVCNLTAENGETCKNRLIKNRYCLIISSDEWNQTIPIYPLILPLSTKEYPGDEIELQIGRNNSNPISYLRMSSIQSVSSCNVISFIGSLSTAKMKAVDEHLAKSFGLGMHKYLKKIEELQAEILRLQEREKDFLSNLHKDINTEASELVLENERLRDEISNLKNTLKYRDKQLTKFSVPIHNDAIEINGTAVISKPLTTSLASVLPAVAFNNKEEEEEKELVKRTLKKRGLVTKTVIDSWSPTKCANLVKFANANTVNAVREKYNIGSQATYYKILNACKSKAYSKDIN